MSLFEGLNVATRGLAAAQLGINVSGQNITNAKVEGYSRKRIEQSAEWRRDGAYGQMGFGVEVYSINRIRNQFIDRLVNEESTRYGYFSMKESAYGRIESIFTEPRDHALNELLNNFWNGWANVHNNPSDAGARETLRSTSQSLVTQFHYVSTQLRSYKDTINDEIESRVNKVNELAAGIYRCNVVIAGTEGAFANEANDTRDQRDYMLEELAKLVDVDYFEDERGALTVTTNGHMLVSAAKNHELVMKRTEQTGIDGYQYSRVDISFAFSGSEFKPKNGEIKALMEVRDVDIPKYENYINELAKTLVTEVNKIHQNGYSLSGLTFIDFFDADPKKLNAANIDISVAVKKDINNIAAGTGGQSISVNEIGLPASYSLSVPGVTAGDFIDLPSLLFPPPNTQNISIDSLTITDGGTTLTAGTDYDIVNGVIEFFVNPGGLVDIEFSYKIPGFSVVPQLNNGTPPDSFVLDLPNYDTNYRFINKNSLVIRDADDNLLQEGKDYDIDYNTGKITFKYSATNAFADPQNLVSISFSYHKSGYGGPGDGDTALLISQLRDKSVMQSDLFGKSTQTINQFYSGMLGRLGVERNEAAAGFDTRVYALEQLKTRQKEIMGVDLNEEMVSLIQYQHTYQASARYLTTINTMLDTLLNM
jgi:flagellar hook-associated protein 1 FlgK